MRRAGFVFVAIFALLGCPPDGLSDTCHFQGETTACGKCIHTACQKPIDSECDGFSYDYDLAQLDKCASGRGCSSFFSSGVVGTCADTNCATVCTP